MLLERKLNVQPNRLASGFVGAEVGSLHDAGAPAGSHDEAVAACRNPGRPFRQHMRQLARVFVVACHVDAGLSALEILLKLRRRCGLAILFDRGHALGRRLASLEAGGSEEYDGVLNLLAAEAGQWLLIL